MSEFWQTLLIACIPSLLTGIITFLVAYKNASSQIKIVKEQNKHDIEKLMEQHKVDIEALKEQHKMEIETIELKHAHELELKQKDFENELVKQEQSAENTAKYGAMKDIMGGLVGGIVSTTMNAPEVKGEFTKAITDALKNRGKK